MPVIMGNLRAVVYDSHLQVVTHLYSSNGTTAESFGCMSTTDNTPQFLRVSGTPNLSFTIIVSFVHKPIMLLSDGTIPNNESIVFNNSQLFCILPRKNTPSGQLDITVKSDSNDEGTLRVSEYCKQVIRYGKILKNEPVLSLTFENKGRITVSKVSRPAFSTSKPLYVFINVAHPKAFSVEAKMSFQYKYRPVLYIFLISFFGGLFIAFAAYFSFYRHLRLSFGCQQINQQDQPNADRSIYSCMETVVMLFKYWRYANELRPFSYTTSIVGLVLFVGGLQFVHLRWETMIKSGNKDRCFYNDFCYRVSPWHDLPFNLMMSNIPYLVHGLTLAFVLLGAELYFIYRAQKLARHIWGCGLIGAVQNTEQEKLPDHALECRDLGLHLPELSMPPLSNPSEDRFIELSTYAYKAKYNFSIGYAFAWALIFEGGFSTVYHLCPSRATFQLDTAFMFVICGLIVVSLFNGLSDVAGSHNKKPVSNNSLFLVVIIPLFIFNYLGFVYNEFSKSTSFDAIFIVIFVGWYITVAAWSFWKLGLHSTKRCSCAYWMKRATFFIVFGFNIFFCILHGNDFSQAFLFSCIFTALISVAAKVCPLICDAVSPCLKFIQLQQQPQQQQSQPEESPQQQQSQPEKIRQQQQSQPEKIPQQQQPQPEESLQQLLPQQEDNPQQPQRQQRSHLGTYFAISYVSVMIALSISALYVFLHLPTTNKTDTPAESRNSNKECVWLGFFDWHDIWHLLSSFALLTSVFPLMFISK